jgi:polysaccharide biosynthesis transport protein
MKETREIIPLSKRQEIERPLDSQIPVGNYPMYRGMQQDEDGFKLSDYWRAIRKRLWLVIGIAILFTTLTAIYIARSPNVYEAKARVQVDLEQVNPDLETSDRRSPMSASDPAYFNTQLQNLTSDSLLRRVIKENSLESTPEFQKLKNDQGVSALQGFLRSIGLASKDEKKEKKGVGEVGVSSVVVSEESEEAKRLAPYVELIKKNVGTEPIRESRSTFKDTRLIDIIYRSNDAEFAAFLVNGIAKTFVKQNQERRSKSSEGTSTYLQEKIAEYQSEIQKDSEKLRDLETNAGILNTGENGQTIDKDRLTGLSKTLLDAENVRKLAEAEYSSVKNSPDRVKALTDQKMAQDLTARNQSLVSFQNETNKKIADLKVERQALLREYTLGSEEVKDKDSQINELVNEIARVVENNKTEIENYRKNQSTSIVTNLQREYERALSNEQKIRASYDSQYSLAQGQNNADINIRILQERLKTNKEFLENLRVKDRENNVVAVGTDNNISVNDLAIEPDKPVGPRRLSSVLAALFLSTLFGAGLALFLEYLDDTIHSTEEVESILGLPAIAAIPTIDAAPRRRLLLVGGNEEVDTQTNSELLIYADSRSSLAEAYRQLRTSILLSTAGHAPKSLLVTSSLPSEGKTTTAVNTAISLAQTGAKVLIIDADMRRPRVHGIFGMSNAEGLSTILSSELKESEILKIVQQEEKSKLFVLPSGPVPPNPAELIGSEQMVKLLKSLEANFTHVVVDSPPIASFTDGVLIASMVDGVILVVHAGKNSRQVIKRSKQLLQDIGARIFGVVLNNVNLKSQGNYYYQSYYHRDYYRTDDE